MELTKEQIKEAIGTCIRKACGQATNEWYAVTVWPDGHIEQRCGIGTMTYSEDEYFGRDCAEETIYVIHGIPNVDELGDWVDEETGELDEEGAIDDIIEKELEMWEEAEQQNGKWIPLPKEMKDAFEKMGMTVVKCPLGEKETYNG